MEDQNQGTAPIQPETAPAEPQPAPLMPSLPYGMEYCTTCGYALSRDAFFCPKCGGPHNRPEIWSRLNTFLLMGIIFFSLALFLAGITLYEALKVYILR